MLVGDPCSSRVRRDCGGCPGSSN